MLEMTGFWVSLLALRPPRRLFPSSLTSLFVLPGRSLSVIPDRSLSVIPDLIGDLLFQVFRDGKQWDSVPEEFRRDKRICAVMDACEFARFDADKKLKFELEMLNEFDRENHLRQEREKGLQEGLEQGREQGREDEKIAIATKMLSDGLDVELVAKYTGLSSDNLATLNQK